MHAIGIDIGTTSICAIRIDTVSGKVIASHTQNSNAFIATDATWEKIQNVDKVISIALALLDEMITPDTVAIGVTGQMHGIVYTDAEGNAVSPLYTWQDGRGNQPYGDTTYAGFLHSYSGYGNVTDFYNRENGLRPANAVCYCTIHDYLVMRLCGLKKPLVHTSDAASFGMYDVEKRTFSYDVPFETVDGYVIAGSYKGIPVSVAIGDNQASVFSTLANHADVLVNVGTGSQISVVSNVPVRAENIETRPYFDGKYLIVGSALCGGRAYSVLKDFYKPVLSYNADVTDDQVYAIMERMLNEPGASVKVDTRFAGTRADPFVRGGIYGLSAENFTPQAMARGVLEGMISELYGMYRLMDSPKTGLVCSGNGIRKNRHLSNLAENTFACKMKVPAHMEEAAFGAALFGTICAGVFLNSTDAQSLISYI